MMSGSALHDPESGLLNEAYFLVALPNRVASARRVLRPLSVALLALGDADARPGRCRPSLAAQVAVALLETLRESDTACRTNDGGFALVLEDTPEDGAIWTIERARRLLIDSGEKLTLWAGVASYPAHALEAPDLLVRASAALALAGEWSQSRIEVAAPAD
jgi:GGDEF domain-containing protein